MPSVRTVLLFVLVLPRHQSVWVEQIFRYSLFSLFICQTLHIILVTRLLFYHWFANRYNFSEVLDFYPILTNYSISRICFAAILVHWMHILRRLLSRLFILQKPVRWFINRIPMVTGYLISLFVATASRSIPFPE